MDSQAARTMFDVPSCGRTAALEHWTREILFGTEARLAWVEPDRTPLPWPPTFDSVAV